LSTVTWDPTPHYLLYQVFHRLNNPPGAEKQLALFKSKEAVAKARKPAVMKIPEN
jgi:hypothetical protein